MANERMEGLTLEMKLDSVGVSEGLKGLKRELGVVNSEMKANLSAFDKSDRSMQKYQTRLDGLNTKLTVQKKMYSQAKQELKDLNTSYKNAGTEIKKVETQLSKLTDEHKKNDQALKKSNDEIKKSNDGLKKARMQQKVVNDEKTKAKQKLDQLRQAEMQLRNSGKATTDQIKKASNATKQQRQVHQNLVEQYKKERATVKQLSDTHKRLKGENDKVKQSYKQSNAELKNTQNQHKKLNKEIQDYTKNQAEATKKINNEKASLNNLEKAIEKTSNEIKLFNKEQALANSHFTKTADKFDKLSDSYSRFGMGLQSVGRNMSMYVTTPIVGALGYASKLGVEFDDSMRKVQATSGASGKQLDQLKAKAREMGATTKFSATDSAEALNYMALAGWKTNDMVKGLPGIMNLAAASGEDLAQVSDIVTDGLTAFGLKAKDSGRFADVLAAASANANTNVLGMGEAFKYAAPVAGALGYTIEDTSIAIGLMSNAGVKGQKAGTALRTMFTNLAKPTKAMKNQMEELGITITDSNGEMLPMRDVLDQLREKFSGLSKDQQASAAATIFGKEAMSGALAVINASESDYTKLSKAIDKSEGSATAMSKTMESGLGGSLRELRSAAEELGLSIFESVQPALKGMVSGLKNTVDYLNGLPKGAKLAAVGFGVITAAIGPLLLGTGLLIRGIGSAMKGYAGLNRVMAKNSVEAGINAAAHSAAGTSMVKTTAKNNKGLSRFTSLIGLSGKSTGKLSTVLRVGSKGLGVFGLAITAVAGTLTYAYKNIDWFRSGVQSLGTFLKEVGSSIDWSWISDSAKWFKKAGSATKDFGTKLLELNPYMQLAKLYFGKLDDAVSKSTDTVDIYGEGVSKGTKKALSKYTDLSEKAKVKLEEIRISHDVIGKEQYKTVSDLYSNINKEVENQLEQRHDKEIGKLTKLFKESDALSGKREQEILQKTKDAHQKELDETQKVNDQIQEIYKTAKDEKRALTEKENEKIASLQSQLDIKVTESLSNGEKEQKVILERMKNNQSALSMEAASNVIKESAKSRDKSIGDAKKKRDDVIKWAIEQRDEAKTLSKDEADKIIKDANDKYKESKDKAKLQHKKVVSEAQKQNKGVKENIDSQNGHVLSSWEKTKNKVSKHAGKMAGSAIGSFLRTSKGATKWLGKATGTAVSKFKSISKGAGDWLGRAAGTAAGKFTSISSSAAKWLGKTAGNALSKFTNVSSSAGKWLGKTAGTATSKFTTVWNSAKDRFNRTRDKAESSTKSVSKSAGKWFGSAAGTAKSRFGEIWGSAKSNFTNVAEHGWNKAKSTYNGFKTWLGRTLKYIRDVGSDMGRAASDLGIKVANNAIEGLNKMIAGVNKISAAITGDNLIKTIDTIGSAGTLGRRLSTGTVGGDVSTDSDGALKQATMAIVNDKGPGNGTGGFTQEIIERKDGSMYMPKGKDVPVMLEPGSKVHSGSVTQQLAKLGLLPKFSTGTPRKKRLDEQLVGAFGKLTGKTVGHGAEALDGIGTLTDKAKGEAGKQAGKASAFVSKSVKDVWDFVDKPKELIKRVMDDFGVNFKSIPAHTGELVRGAYKKLKSSLADKVTSMFDEFGSSGGGYNPFADWPITPGRGWKSGGHAGIDYAVPAGTKIPSPLDGEVIQRWFSPYGGGNETQVYDGSKYTHIFMHQSKQIAKKGQRINQGDTIGLVGNTGNSFGAHLHWQVNKGKGFRNNHPDSINPLDWVKEAMAAGGAGGKGAAYARKIIKQAQNILGGRYKSPAITEHMMKLAKRESNFDPKAVNNWDSNAQRGTPSKGMFQMIEPTFRANAKSGYNKFGNTLHEAISSLQYIVRTYGWGGFPRAASAAYANGGISSTHKIAQISEGNKAEAIVPLTKRTRAIQLTEQIMDYLGMDTGKSNVTVNNDTSVMEKLLKQLVSLNDKSNRQTDVIIKLMKQIPEGTDISKLEPMISTLQGSRLNNANYTMGGAR
ncbi:phage tail tape measure protein [Mammaliicoccus sp. R-M65]|uniref:phage tail tape measure protein n=1 Tax=Mammaliicoccus sp. R-M65 TaxID=2898724 RepID=UPI001EFA665E|nr:phage tail tape measure protein [Mammaliicoccus sp. R-M65]